MARIRNNEGRVAEAERPQEARLYSVYKDILAQPIPQRFLDLLKLELDNASSSRPAQVETKTVGATEAADYWSLINTSLQRTSQHLSEMAERSVWTLGRINSVGDRIDRETAQNREYLKVILASHHG